MGNNRSSSSLVFCGSYSREQLMGCCTGDSIYWSDIGLMFVQLVQLVTVGVFDSDTFFVERVVCKGKVYMFFFFFVFLCCFLNEVIDEMNRNLQLDVLFSFSCFVLLPLLFSSYF